MTGGDYFSLAHDALDRMRRAERRGTGCHLTAEMIQALGLTFLGEVWNEIRPEPPTTEKEKD